MRPSSRRYGWIALAFAQLAAALVPQAARALTGTFCSSGPAPTTIITSECEVLVCVEADRAWDTRPKAFGVVCGPTDPVTHTRLGFCSGTGSCVNPEVGRVTPLYMILDVQYSPPGLGSSVSSSQKRSMGVKTSVGSSFTRTGGVAFTVSASSPLGKAGFEVGFESGDTTTKEDSVTVAHSVTSTELLGCDPLFLCTDSIDHRLDLVYILAKPAVEYRAFVPGTRLPDGRTHVEWGLDASGAVVVPLRVGWLTGVLDWPNGFESDLVTYFGITPDEYPKILSATGYAYATQWAGDWNPDPSRYEPAPLMYGAPGFAYVFGEPDYSGDVTNTRTVEHTDTYSTTHSVDITGEAGPTFGKILSVGVKTHFSWKWTNSTSTTTSQADETIESFLINMPPPEYSGRRFMWAYLDKLYSTFVFSFCSANYAVPGCASGPPVPDQPTNLAAVAAPTHASVSVSWTPVAGATGYILKRGTSPTALAGLASNLDGFSFEDQGATLASPYYYQVSALNGAGTGKDSALAVVPATPAGVAAVTTYPSVTLSWAPAAEATSYTVWRSASSYGPWDVLASGVTGTTATDTAPPVGARYYYVVGASSATGAGARSSAVQAVSPPATPTGVTASAGNAYVSVSWTAAAGATAYEVQRSLSSAMTTPTTFTGIATTYKYDSPLTNGTTYYYRVRAVNSSTGGAAPNQASAWSAVVSARPVAPPPPDPIDTGCPPYPRKCL